MIILEGPDGSGKTTLAMALSKAMGWPVIGGEGPPKSPEEFRDRLEKYHALPNDIILDRHSVITDPIYAEAFGRPNRVTDSDLWRLRSREHFIVQCMHPRRELSGQHDNPHSDNHQFVLQLEEKHGLICDLYDDYFVKHPPQVRYILGHAWPKKLLRYMAHVALF